MQNNLNGLLIRFCIPKNYEINHLFEKIKPYKYLQERKPRDILSKKSNVSKGGLSFI